MQHHARSKPPASYDVRGRTGRRAVSGILGQLSPPPLNGAPACAPPLPPEAEDAIEDEINSRAWQLGRAGLLASASPLAGDGGLLDAIAFEQRLRRAFEPEGAL